MKLLQRKLHQISNERLDKLFTYCLRVYLLSLTIICLTYLISKVDVLVTIRLVCLTINILHGLLLVVCVAIISVRFYKKREDIHKKIYGLSESISATSAVRIIHELGVINLCHPKYKKY